MRSVTIPVAQALQIITANRETHREVFLQAQEGYKKKVIEVLEERLEQARQGQRFDTVIYLDVPQDHTLDYDRVIKMLQMSVDANVELTAAEFDQYIQDRWPWRDAFINNSSTYAAGATAAAYGK